MNIVAAWVKIFMDVFNGIIAALLVIAALVLLIHMFYRNRDTNVDNIINLAVSKATFNPGVFKIYDNSTENKCNRLIEISPFGWVVWAYYEELYILNPEGGIVCAIGRTPAVRVYADRFIETCLKISYDSIIHEYKRLPVKHVPYEIDDNTFTILSALNILVKDWITFEIHVKRTKVRFVHTEDVYDEHALCDPRASDILACPAGKRIPPEELIKITTSHKRSRRDLVKLLERHLPR
uniref:PIF-4 n=1 Tax=Venturia canescens TaxID=32260 RepID=A0A0U1ZHS9_9HYME|nr:PIF-4 [Venturia canescens]